MLHFILIHITKLAYLGVEILRIYKNFGFNITKERAYQIYFTGLFIGFLATIKKSCRLKPYFQNFNDILNHYLKIAGSRAIYVGK